MWLTDQDNNPIDVRGERVTARIVIREVKQTIKEVIEELKVQKII